MTTLNTKVVAGKVRFSYVHVFEAVSMSEGQDAKYSVCLLIPKKNTALVKELQDAINAAVQKGVSEKWGGKKPGNLKLPLRDGDQERADEFPEYKGMYFLNASSNRKPGVVDADRNEIIDASELYSGCYGYASINFYPFNNNGNKGVAVGLNNIMKTNDGEPLGGVATPADTDFADVEVGDTGFLSDEELAMLD